MKKDWTKKCTCENFQQNEDCEHIGNKVLEEVGMLVEEVHDTMGIYHIADTHIEEQPKEEVGLGVGDKDCPDCRPDDGCAKHYIKNGDRHDRLEGALTPLGEKLMEQIFVGGLSEKYSVKVAWWKLAIWVVIFGFVGLLLFI